MKLTSFAAGHPVAFALGAMVAWFALLIVLTIVASNALGKPFDDPAAAVAPRLAVAACVVALIWRLGWLRSSGIACSGDGRVWLLALAGMVYFAGASLYSFFGRLAFDASALALPAARAVVLTALAVGLCEELLFRGAALHALARAWGGTPRGLVVAVVFTSLLFAALHFVQAAGGGLSPASVLLLVAETTLISLWWGALVLAGGSIWPAVVLHAVVNAVVAVQALSAPALEPGTAAYARALWFSIPLGILGVALLARTPGPSTRSEELRA